MNLKKNVSNNVLMWAPVHSIVSDGTDYILPLLWSTLSQCVPITPVLLLTRIVVTGFLVGFPRYYHIHEGLRLSYHLTLSS